MLQTQLVSLSNIAWAIEMEMTGETNPGGLSTEVSGTVEVEPEVGESNEEISGGITGEVVDENLNVVPEEGKGEVEEQPEEPVQEPAEEPVEEPSEEPMPEEQPEEPVQDSKPEEKPEVEEVVEPKVEVNIKSENSSIYKGYLYANATSNLRYETNYNTIEEVIIQGSKNGISKVVVKENEDKIKMITAAKMALLNDIYYKKTRVSVDEFKNILGENGTINIYDASGDFVGYIDAKTPEVNGYYEYNFKYYTNSVSYELSIPIADGTIRIINDKAIKEDSLYSREQIVTFSTINVTADVEMLVGENLLTASNEGDITLQETEAKIEMELDKTELSTEDVNELTLTLTLKTDAERYELFKNPIIEVEMPSNINELSIEGVNLLYKNGLSLDTWEIVTRENGNKVLRIKMSGAQSVYTPGIVQQGTTLVVYLKATVNKLTANTSETIKLTYTNEGSVRQAYVLEGKNAEEMLLTFVAKHGMLKGATAINNDLPTLVGNSYEDEIDKIEIKSNAEAQRVTITGTIVNNFEKDVKDVVIIGRIPFVGNMNGKGEDLFSEFNTMLGTEIMTSGNLTEVYYSTDGNADKDSETWTQDVSDISQYKSYKIVVKEGTLKKGERVDFTYEIIAPEKLGYNLRSYAIYSVVYKLDNQELSGDCAIAILTEQKELEAEDMPTQEEADTIYERQILRYTVVVTNTSNEVLTNIKLIGKAENANMYNWKYIETENYWGHDVYISRQLEEDIDGSRPQDEMIIERLAPGESATFEYQAIAKMLPEEMIEGEEIEVYGLVTVISDDSSEKTIETIKNVVKDAKLEVRTGYAGTEDVEENDALTGGELKVYGYIKNITNETLKNVELNIVVPKELLFEEGNRIFGANDLEMQILNLAENKIVKFTISELSPGESREVFLSTEVADYDLTIKEKMVTVSAYGNVSEETYYSNDYRKLTKQGETIIEHSWTSNVNKESLEHEEEVTLTFSIKNVGYMTAGNIKISTDIEPGFRVVNVVLRNGDTELTYEQTEERILGNVHLGMGEEIVLEITYKVDENYFLKDQESLNSKISVTQGLIEEFETEVISYKIHNENVTIKDVENKEEVEDTEKPDEGKNPSDVPVEDENINNEEPPAGELQTPENQIKPEVEQDKYTRTYLISGKVWLDSNKDGINRNENGVQSVVVMLFKTTDKGNLTTMVKQTVTDVNGAYTFTEVADGNYVVIFGYDTSLYNSTKYRVSTATTSENSDAITKAVNINGSNDIYGITDMITINGAGAIDVDLGLVNRNEFDLSLEKYITSATVKNKEGTKTYKYEQEKNVKLEIHSKYFKNSQIDITYKIIVKNTGEVDGYVNKIVDYVPNDMKFDNNKNTEWYYGDDGNLYYKGLVGMPIKPGETKEITLVLTKVLDTGEAGKLVNGAEIAEATNSMGLMDIDSTPANKERGEDDYGEVALMIAISTGSEAKNIALLILTLLIIMIVVYIAKFKTTKKVYR